ncbi:hypothetical protein VYU27_003674 [Nannochloropsis oceanica]
MELKEVARAAIHGLVQRGARKQQRELYPLRAAEPRKLQADQSVYEQLEEEGWGLVPAVVPVGYATGKGDDNYHDDDSGGGYRVKRKRSNNNRRDKEGCEDDDEEEDDEDRSMLSKAGIRGGRPGSLTTWELNHYRRRHFLMPQGAWPILPSASPTPPPVIELPQGNGYCRPPPPEALPDNLGIDGVQHYIPRIRVSGGARRQKNKRALEAAETQLEWLPFENLAIQTEKREDDNYPIPSPVLVRALDAAIVRQLVGVVQAHQMEEEDEFGDKEEDEKEDKNENEEEDRERKTKSTVEVRLYDLLESALGTLEEDKDEGGGEDDYNDGEDGTKNLIRKRMEAVHVLRRCLGRETERLIDGLLGHVLACWSERSQAQRSEERYLAWLRRQRACNLIDPRNNVSLEDRVGFAGQGLILGDWHDVLGVVEERMQVDMAAAKGREEGRRKAEKVTYMEAKRQMKEKMKYSKSGRRKLNEHGRKLRTRLDENEEQEELEEEKAREEEGEVNLLRPAFDPGTLSRSRARLERLFWAGKGALPPEEGL